jgi:hypothetical protein
MYKLALVAFETSPGWITYAYTVINGAPSKFSTMYLILDFLSYAMANHCTLSLFRPLHVIQGLDER